MCGIAGIVQKKQAVDRELFGRMVKQLAHRGPEDEGIWVSEKGTVGLGQRRLSIIDLSAGGHQPMLSEDGRFVITFNGEIYNYLELKQELVDLGWSFKTESDTEVLLIAYMQWQEKCLSKLNGMFAFAIWDNKEEYLFAARDRMGERPFKYYIDENVFLFASELKAILEHEEIRREVDWQAIDSALSLRFVPAPATGFKNIFKLPAGHYLYLRNGELSIKKYWDAGDVQEDRKKSYADFKHAVWNLFVDSTRKRMISDVPLGAFLSGGVDSTSVVMAMKELTTDPIDTFVISMGGESEDQRYAAMAAKHFGTRHHEIAISDIDYVHELSALIDAYDEPFFDQSALPTTIISRHIKKHVTVVLSGDGGDELFGGYDSYAFAQFLEKYQRLPKVARATLIPKLLSFSQGHLYRAEVLGKDFFDAYAEYYSVWKNSLPRSKKYITKDDLYLPWLKSSIDRDHVAKQMKEWFGPADGRDIANRAMIADFRGRLADGYMTKTDIGSMASALEMRPPFLDHRLVELAGSIPAKWKMRDGKGKYIWKDIVKDKLPTEILTRKKVGFSIPLHRILVDQMKAQVEDILLDSSSNIYGAYSFETVKQLWSDHVSGKADYSNHIWSLLVLELWLRKYFKK